ncbi:MAG: GNAT family N-acetyltransferase [Candidatus Poribacteria bacterium]
MEDIKECAYLHHEFIKDSFLCEFGIEFLQRIYNRLIESDGCFGYVYTDNSKVIGFITGSENMGKFMKALILRDFFVIALKILIRLIVKPFLVKNVIQILFYSKKSSVEDVKAELVSIVVKEDYRGQKIGTFLLNNLINHFRRNGVFKFKVMVDKNNIEANAFYKASGFKLYLTTSMYNKNINLYVYE